MTSLYNDRNNLYVNIISNKFKTCDLILNPIFKFNSLSAQAHMFFKRFVLLFDVYECFIYIVCMCTCLMPAEARERY